MLHRVLTIPRPFARTFHANSYFLATPTKLPWTLLVPSRPTAHRLAVPHFRLLQSLSSAEIRTRFTDYFAAEGHQRIESSSLIPHNDRTLLFTNAGKTTCRLECGNGAVQGVFSQTWNGPIWGRRFGPKMHACRRYVLSLSPQWLRLFIFLSTLNNDPYTLSIVSTRQISKGKHNDLDNVGHTPRHHTFFEMLGNFSFGLYSKAQAIRYAWYFLTEELKLPIDRLRVTVLETDQESFEIWRDQEGLTEDQIVRCGAEDNFWSMGDGEGPCGPCTEIFWDTQDETNPERPDLDSCVRNIRSRWLEIWNLVFMQNFRTAEGVLEALPIPCVDTGMGIERLASVLQGKKNNYQIDSFQILISGLNEVMAKRGLLAVSNSGEPSSHEKIIADHFRAMCFLINDGVIPRCVIVRATVHFAEFVLNYNIGRGYVLRRIIRRALRSGRQLGFNTPFMTKLYPYLLTSLGHDAYPDLTLRAAPVCNIIEQEEHSFLATLEKGLALLEELFARADLREGRRVPANAAFRLYDTYGFPVDLTEVIAGERGWEVDLEGMYYGLDRFRVEELQEKQKKLGRASWKSFNVSQKARLSEWRNSNIFPTFTGYDHSLLHQESMIVAVDVPQDVTTNNVVLAIEPCPFYGLGGGQVPDMGHVMLASGRRWDVVDVFQPYEGGMALSVKPAGGEVVEEDLVFLQVGGLVLIHICACTPVRAQPGQLVRTHVNLERREGAETHHTATHLLNAALKGVLRMEVIQAGSLVEPNRLRFDFTYGKPVTPEQLGQIENWVNDVTLSKALTEVKHMPLKDAIDSGAVAVFSEKYTDIVRVIEVPNVSKELCGGTHVNDIAKIYPFKIVSEASVAAGMDRYLWIYFFVMYFQERRLLNFWTLYLIDIHHPVGTGTRRIEAVAGRACVDWYRKQYEPIPRVLSVLRVSMHDRFSLWCLARFSLGTINIQRVSLVLTIPIRFINHNTVSKAKSTSEIDQKLTKLLDHNKDLQRQLSSTYDKLARAPDPWVPLTGRYKDHSLQLHLVDAELDAAFLQARANFLKEDRPRELHVLVWRSTMVVAVNGEELKDVDAGVVSRLMAYPAEPNPLLAYSAIGLFRYWLTIVTQRLHDNRFSKTCSRPSMAKAVASESWRKRN
ncbi:alanyl-tRNA synthetase [Endogone sp. FLAS-F59071]|nr:alanyl-tRNA synthetase [Endogone sp. FLAS-F59071]|eukprot:RUS20321.1 alanyl-tRNA synthetase [Endogone sp. FLAS-F59071]